MTVTGGKTVLTLRMLSCKQRSLQFLDGKKIGVVVPILTIIAIHDHIMQLSSSEYGLAVDPVDGLIIAGDKIQIIMPGNLLGFSDRVYALTGRTKYPLMLPLPFGEGTVS